ncbi:MAG TPA: hypothetical protein ENK66_07420 [Arcobacter sp.]|nr:hypothetical protein [Arcobacter sp.]
MHQSTKLHCKLIVHSNEQHLQHIYSGLSLLEKNGLISLEQEIQNVNTFDNTKLPHLRNAKLTHCKVIINEQIILFYDMHDSWEVDEEELQNCDHYFKRSYSSKNLTYLGHTSKKVHPYGLNFWSFSDTFDLNYLKRNLQLRVSIRKKIFYTLYSFPFFDTLSQTVRLTKMQIFPDIFQRPKIFFLVKAFNPSEISDHTPDKIKEREEINESRAKTIKLLKEEFGDDFIGGFNHSSYAVKNYSEYLIQDKNITKRQNYIKTMQNCSICIATTGLHGSIGWKVAEYTASGSAIVSEKLNYEVIGNFKKDQNYLEFKTPEQCLKQVKLLYSNEQQRRKMMLKNISYYSKYVRPDQIVLHSLVKALNDTHK